MCTVIYVYENLEAEFRKKFVHFVKKRFVKWHLDTIGIRILKLVMSIVLVLTVFKMFCVSSYALFNENLKVVLVIKFTIANILFLNLICPKFTR